MKKINNLKIEFSKVLSEKYYMTQEGIDGYWANKEREERYDERSRGYVALGLLGFSLALTTSNFFSDSAPTLPVITSFISGVMFSRAMNNPYTLDEYSELDKEYEKFKVKYKIKNDTK